MCGGGSKVRRSATVGPKARRSMRLLCELNWEPRVLIVLPSKGSAPSGACSKPRAQTRSRCGARARRRAGRSRVRRTFQSVRPAGPRRGWSHACLRRQPACRPRWRSRHHPAEGPYRGRGGFGEGVSRPQARGEAGRLCPACKRRLRRRRRLSSSPFRWDSLPPPLSKLLLPSNDTGLRITP